MLNPAAGQGRGALEAPHVQEYIQSFESVDESGAYQVAAPGKARLFVHVIGAAVSLAVIGACGWWGYKQIMRDLHGIPVVQALEGPMRIAPDDPGGMVASHSGLAVNSVQAEGVAAVPESQLILAPQPVRLAEEDQTAAELAPAESAEATEDDQATLLARVDPDDAELAEPAPMVPTVASLTEEVPSDDPLERALALADAATAGAIPLSESAEAEEPAETVESAIEAAVRTAAIEASLDGLSDTSGMPVSPRPAPRPGARVLAAPEATEQLASIAPASVDPTSIEVGTRLVQLGAFESQDEAKRAWDILASAFDGLLDDKQQVLVEANAGGRSFWRLRALGFADLAEARRFCAALVAERAECIPVVVR
ncbi:SPOR domain-containing protein [Tropicimonas sediminicola]|uniref:Sporulation related domain-containing protein n=1 Tax=Tropicimonas sediminicola TaxID=1031541 RepID=A0A239GZY1_9RHOB|nr:SPOR domain-containing protein [Tropicimonas sediminicola]SNS73574.1 Sporulation related domain-containing protein [Tropicimonas sediminicola]